VTTTFNTKSDTSNSYEGTAQAIQLLKGKFEHGDNSDYRKDQFIDILSRFVNEYPEAENEAFHYGAEFLSTTVERLKKQVEAYILERDARLQSVTVIEGMAPLADNEYGVDDLVCKSVARRINASASRTSGDPFAHLIALLPVMGALLGSNVRVYSGIRDGHLPLTFRALLVANSSEEKSVTTKKVTGPLQSIERANRAAIEAALAEINKQTTIKNDDGDEVRLSPEDKKAMKKEVTSNQHAVFFDSKSFSGEAAIKKVANQKSKAGLLLFKDEASDLLQHENYGAKTKGSTSQTTGLMKTTIMTSQTEPLYGSYDRVNEENGGTFEGQTLNVLGNIQLHFLPNIIDFQEDSHGWGSRWLLCRAKRSEGVPVAQVLSGVDPLNSFVNNRLIPFLMGITPTDATEVNEQGLPVDYILLGFDAPGQELYRRFVDATKLRISQERKGEAHEAAYLTWLDKSSVRIPQIAALLHILELLEGKQIDVPRTAASDIKPDETNNHLVISTFNSNEAFKPDRRERKTFDDVFGRGWLNISEENVHRAIRMEEMLGDEFLKISDQATVAVRIRQSALINTELRTDLNFVLKRLEDKGDILQSAFKSSLRGGRLNLPGPELQGRIEELVDRGCIKRWKQDNKTYITYLKPLRN